MKKLQLHFFLVGFVFCLFGPAVKADQAVVRAASELDYPPFSIVRPDGTADGFSVDLLKASLAAMGREVVFEVDTWSTIKAALEHGRLDVLPLVGRTPERETVFDFTVPYLKLFGAVFVHENTHGITELADLRERSVGVLQGDNAEEFLRRQKITHRVMPFVTYEEAFQQLADGQVDAVLAQRLVGLNLIDSLGLENVKTAIAPVKAFRQDFSFAVTEGDSELLAVLNEGLAIVHASGEYDRLYKKWLGILDRESERQINRLRTFLWLLATVAFLLLGFLLFVLWRSYQRLRVDEEKFRTLFQNMVQGVFYQAADGSLTDCNQAALDIFGMTRDQFLGSTSFDPVWRVIKEDGSALSSENHPSMIALTTGLPASALNIGIYNALKDDFVWVEIHAIPQFRDRQSKPYQVFVTLHDITELRQLGQRYHAVFEQAAVGIARVGADGSWLEVNQKLCDIVGYSEAELLQLTFQEITYPEDLESSLGYVRQMLSGEIQNFSMEKRYVRKNGALIWINLTVSLRRNPDGSPKFFISVVEDIDQRKQTEEALKLSQARYQTLVESAPLGLYETDGKGRCVFVNRKWQEMTGLTRQQALGEGWRESLCEDDRQRIGQLWREFAAEGSIWDQEYRICSPVGTTKWVLGTAVPLRDNDGHISGYLGANLDITERKDSEQRLQLAASVFTNAREGILISDSDNRVVEVNSAFTEITGYSIEDVLGKDPKVLASGQHDRAFYRDMWDKLKHSGHWYGEIQNRRKDGEIYTEALTISTIRGLDGEVENYLAMFNDITLQKASQKQLEHTAHYDALTHLPNRLLLSDRMKQAIARAIRSQQQLAVVYLDLDGFKQINDTHGHAIGDRLLVRLARDIKASLRDDDTFARIGGDEFVAILGDLPNTKACIPLLTRLLDQASRPVHIDELTLQVSASLGVTFLPEDPPEADVLLRQADQAMYQAKLAGKNRYHMFDVEQDRSLRGQYKSLDAIRQAFRNNEFELYYQPKVNMRSGEVIGAEALIRWHKGNDLLLPGDFLSILLNHPLEIELDEWVINQALLQSKDWREAGLDIRISVNITATLLQQTDFLPRLQRLLHSYPTVPPGSLELEVVESTALEDISQASSLIQQCHELGVSFSLDDFGTGYASLSYLKRLPVDFLKIDRSFVRDMLEDTDDLAILEGVLGLAEAFHMNVIAEGVETIEHGQLLLRLGCENGQGFIIAKPMPAKEFPAWVRGWQPDDSWRDLDKLHHEDRSLLLAGIEHRAWVRQVDKYLTGHSSSILILNERQCRFGHWLDTDGMQRYGQTPGFEAVVAHHRKLHELAKDLIEDKCEGEDVSAQRDDYHSASKHLIELLDRLL